MAAVAFFGVMQNEWDNPLVHLAHSSETVMNGNWTAPWNPCRVWGAGQLNRGDRGEWGSESDGMLTGTSGWSLWGVMVDVILGSPIPVDSHFEFVLVSWSVPATEDGDLEIRFAVFRSDPREPISDTQPPELEIVGSLLLDDGSAPPNSAF
jgi:hypothetical protein